MTEDEVLGLQANIERLKAIETMDEARLGKVRLSPDGWYDVVLEATGSVRQAEHAHFVAAKEQVKEGREN